MSSLTWFHSIPFFYHIPNIPIHSSEGGVSYYLFISNFRIVSTIGNRLNFIHYILFLVALFNFYKSSFSVFYMTFFFSFLHTFNYLFQL